MIAMTEEMQKVEKMPAIPTTSRLSASSFVAYTIVEYSPYAKRPQLPSATTSLMRRNVWCEYVKQKVRSSIGSENVSHMRDMGGSFLRSGSSSSEAADSAPPMLFTPSASWMRRTSAARYSEARSERSQSAALDPMAACSTRASNASFPACRLSSID
jgi:hypothetical protein